MASKIHQISNVLYAPWGYGQRKIGVEHGCSHIMHYINELTSSSDRPPHTQFISIEASHAQDNERYHHQVFEARTQVTNTNTLVVGGDHSVAIGSLLGTLQSVNNLNRTNSTNHKLGVIWIDAHADINTLESSASGNVHGMPLAFLTGIDRTWDWVNDTQLMLPFEDLYYWGIRDLDNFEIDIIDNCGIKVCSDKDAVFDVIAQYEYIHTSLDIDGLDPKYAPSTGTRADHGLELKDVLDYLYYVKFSNKCMGFDLVEYNPDLGTEQEKLITEQSVKSIL
eukprot:338882_1